MLNIYIAKPSNKQKEKGAIPCFRVPEQTSLLDLQAFFSALDLELYYKAKGKHLKNPFLVIKNKDGKELATLLSSGKIVEFPKS